MTNDISTQLTKVQTPQVAKNDEKALSGVVDPTLADMKQAVKDKKEQANDTEVTAEKVKEKVSQLNEQMQSLNRSLTFTVDEDSGDSIVTVRDSETEEVIRQFPSDELLKARHAVDNVKGMLIEVDV